MLCGERRDRGHGGLKEFQLRVGGNVFSKGGIYTHDDTAVFRLTDSGGVPWSSLGPGTFLVKKGGVPWSSLGPGTFLVKRVAGPSFLWDKASCQRILLCQACGRAWPCILCWVLASA